MRPPSSPPNPPLAPCDAPLVCTTRDTEQEGAQACSQAAAAGRQCVLQPASGGRRLFEALAPPPAPPPPKPPKPPPPPPPKPPPKVYPANLPHTKLVVGIVHVPEFAHRRALLATTREALDAYVLVVACTRGDTHGAVEAAAPLPDGCDVASDGLGEARNDIVHVARSVGATHLMMLDDDVLATPPQIEALRAAMRAHPEYDLVAGVYAGEPEALAHDLLFDDRTMTMMAVEGLDIAPHEPRTTDLVHNAFLVKLSALDAAPWDARAKMEEHLLFFVKLKLRGTRVAVLPAVALEHRPLTDKSHPEFAAYEQRRHVEADHWGLMCLNLPKLQLVVTPWARLDCHARTLVLPMQRPEPVPLTQWWVEHKDEEDLAGARLPGMPVSTSVLVLIPTRADERGARARLRATWLAHIPDLSTMDYWFIVDGGLPSQPARRVGDVMRLPLAMGDVYEKLTHKVLAAYQDALVHDEFDWILKCDSDSWVKPLPLAAWLLSGACTSGYCGMERKDEVPARDAQSWWTVPTELYGREKFPPYIVGGGIAVGRHALARMVATTANGQNVLPMIEDASMGLWAEAAGVTPQHSPAFRELPPPAARQGGDAMALGLACCDAETLVYHRPLSFHVCDACDKDTTTQRRALTHLGTPETERCGTAFSNHWCCKQDEVDDGTCLFPGSPLCGAAIDVSASDEARNVLYRCHYSPPPPAASPPPYAPGMGPWGASCECDHVSPSTPPLPPPPPPPPSTPPPPPPPPRTPPPSQPLGGISMGSGGEQGKRLLFLSDTAHTIVFNVSTAQQAGTMGPAIGDVIVWVPMGLTAKHGCANASSLPVTDGLAGAPDDQEDHGGVLTLDPTTNQPAHSVRLLGGEDGIIDPANKQTLIDAGLTNLDAFSASSAYLGCVALAADNSQRRRRRKLFATSNETNWVLRPDLALLWYHKPPAAPPPSPSPHPPPPLQPCEPVVDSEELHSSLADAETRCTAALPDQCRIVRLDAPQAPPSTPPSKPPSPPPPSPPPAPPPSTPPSLYSARSSHPIEPRTRAARSPRSLCLAHARDRDRCSRRSPDRHPRRFAARPSTSRPAPSWPPPRVSPTAPSKSTPPTPLRGVCGTRPR